MEFTDITTGSVGLVMLFLGINWSLQSLIVKAVIEFPLVRKTDTFEIIKTGLYSICLIGGSSVEFRCL